MNANINKVSNVNGLEEVKRQCDLNFGSIGTVLNGQIEFGLNIKSSPAIAFEIKTANQVIQIQHGLSYVPSNYFVVYQNAGAILFAANASQYQWSKNSAFLTATAPVSGRLIFF